MFIMTDTLAVKVLRSTGPDAPANFQSFTVPCVSRMSVLDVVARIQSDHDSTLGFRYSCRAGMCGTCSMRVNGKNRWTCRTPAEPFRKQGLTLEPLPNYPVIRDLCWADRLQLRSRGRGQTSHVRRHRTAALLRENGQRLSP